MILSYPRIEWSWLAWFALVPLMFVLDGKRASSSFGLAYLSGIIFFAGTLFWIGNVTVLGTSLLVLYFALYFGGFGLIYKYSEILPKIGRLFFIPAGWTFLEFIRARLFSGFDWVSLGHSQYKFLPVIQIADIMGVFGVSFVVMLINVTLKDLVSASISAKKVKLEKTFIMGISVFVFVILYGYIQLSLRPQLIKRDIAVVQPNIDQRLKWQEPLWPDIMKKTMLLSRAAVRNGPALLIWPETSLPGIFEKKNGVFEDQQDFLMDIKSLSVSSGVPVLLGAVTENDGRYYNSALLVNGKSTANAYHKVHLVPFGEFVPFGNILPFLKKIVPIDDFTPGKEYTVFELSDSGSKGLDFAVLICFEDTFAGVARKLVRNGASLLINITNDSWFGDTKAPFLHLQSAVFRSIENRRMLVRCANTGVSSFIDRYGKITKIFGESVGKMTYAAGFMQYEAHFGEGVTFYTIFGDVFAYLCGIYLFVSVWAKKRFKI